MDAYTSEAPRGIRNSVSAFTDEIEGGLEKVSCFGVHMTRKVVLSIFGIFAIVCVAIGITLGTDLSSSSINGGVSQIAFREDHRFWALGEVIESSVGKAIYDNTTHQHEALIWLAESDPLRLEPTSPIGEILQRFVLANLYFATNGNEWTNQFHFFSKKNVCQWNDKTSGVFCDDNSHVSKLLFPEINLNGTIPHDIGLLSQMEILNLTKNELQGSIPMSFGIMSSLTNIDFSFNFINGEIPKSFAMLLDLEFIDLSFNKIEGTDGISAFKDLPSLEELHLQYNLLGGNVGQFGNSESLRVIDLSFNAIDGSMPMKFLNGKELKYLKFNNNQIRGQIPDGIGKLENLVEFDISENKITGSLPLSLLSLPVLETLKLSSNKIQHLPAMKGVATEFKVLELSENGIEKIPRELFHSENLESLTLSYNRISGSLPTEIGLATSLVELDLSHNKISNELPSELGTLNSLEHLYLNNNLFDGTIPSELSNLYFLKELDISHNSFFGNMDSQLCGDRPDSGNPVEMYKADCLTGDISFSCATECCDGQNYCCPAGETECL